MRPHVARQVNALCRCVATALLLARELALTHLYAAAVYAGRLGVKVALPAGGDGRRTTAVVAHTTAVRVGHPNPKCIKHPCCRSVLRTPCLRGDLVALTRAAGRRQRHVSFPVRGPLRGPRQTLGCQCVAADAARSASPLGGALCGGHPAVAARSGNGNAMSQRGGGGCGACAAVTPVRAVHCGGRVAPANP